MGDEMIIVRNFAAVFHSRSLQEDHLKTRLCLFAFTVLVLFGNIHAQVIFQPLYVIDNGGGKFTSGQVTLSASIAQPFADKSSSGDFVLSTGFIPGVVEYSGVSSAFTQQVDAGWNMVSVPLLVSNYHKSALYPTAISNAFSYAGGYTVQNLLENGMAYWVKFPGEAAIPMVGTSISEETVAVAANWNMIGCISYRVARSAVAPINTSMTSRFFGYSSSIGYFPTDTLGVGQGYWIKVSHAGKLILNSGSASPTTPAMDPSIQAKASPSLNKNLRPPTGHEDINSFVIKDALGRERMLYFSTTGKEVDFTRYELPPPAPEGMLDVRYSSNRSLAIADEGKNKEVPILISSAVYPLSIHWENAPNGASLLINGKEVVLRATGQTSIANPESPIRLTLLASTAIELPKEFALQQNYPNPFNPLTVIRYSLPVTGHVTLEIYNVLGQEVVVLVDGILNAGYKSVEWNASGVPSSLYFYRMTAGNNTTIKKMILVK